MTFSSTFVRITLVATALVTLLSSSALPSQAADRPICVGTNNQYVCV